MCGSSSFLKLFCGKRLNRFAFLMRIRPFACFAYPQLIHTHRMGFIARKDNRRNGGMLTQVGSFGMVCKGVGTRGGVEGRDSMQRVADELGRGCRDKGRRSGREGALCLSWGRERLRWYSGCSEVGEPTGRGQARGPRNRPT